MLEVVGPEAQRDAAPVIGAAAEHPRAIPVEALVRPVVYGSPSIVHDPMQPSNSPNSRFCVVAPRRGESYGHAIIFESFAESHHCPASSITTLAPAFVST